MIEFGTGSEQWQLVVARYQRRGVRTAKPVQLTEAQRRAEGEVTGYKKDPAHRNQSITRSVK